MTSNLHIGQDIVTKFNVKNKPIFVKVFWTEDSTDLFHIKVFYEGNTWSGNYSTELAARRRERLDENADEYNTNVKNCLNGDTKDCIIDFVQSPDDINSASFIWKKQYENALKTQGIVPLQRDEVPMSKDLLIDSLLEKNKDLHSQIALAKRTNEDLKQEQEKYLQGLQELTESKILLESTLYSRFVQVLNEKKKRIQLLEDHIKSL